METIELKITSPAFDNEGDIPEKYTCDGDKINPPLHIEGLPHETQTLVLIVEDPDAPGKIFDHWIIWGIDAVSTIPENSNPGISGKNGAGKTGYYPPCPPSGTHRYFFYVFALDNVIDLPTNSTKQELNEAMNGHIIAQGTLMGKYKSKN